MRKIKKINGYLVVKFNDRELREWEGTALGNYGVIDAELYTGQLENDRSVMEYDGAKTLEEAIEQARGLESELDAEEPSTTYTVVKETDETTEEEDVDPQLMIAGWETTLEQHIGSHRHPDVTPATARHQLYGFKVALYRLGLIDSDECFVTLDTFADLPPKRVYCDSGAVFDESVKEPSTFAHLPPDKRDSGTARRAYALGKLLEQDCPQNDCRVFLNIFGMCRELDEQAALLTGRAREVVEAALRKQYFELETMFVMNYAIKQYRKEAQP
ncbi:MAG: hypothetical protein ACOYJZ_01165 [Acutalibacter sp.]|jgi:hypothetical protein